MRIEAGSWYQHDQQPSPPLLCEPGPVTVVLCLYSLARSLSDSPCSCHHAYRQLEVCLGEVENSQLFVGILGSRYGYVPPNYSLPDHPHFRWVKQLSLGEWWERPGERKGHSVSGAWDSAQACLRDLKCMQAEHLQVTTFLSGGSFRTRSGEVLPSDRSDF